MKKKVNFIIPYFGKFPNYMQLYLNSCAKNPDFHWTLFTDDYDKYFYPDNVKVVHTTFEEIKKSIQEKFDFPIILKRPYKLCDMKPMYGYLFEEYNVDYDYWGYCDVDVILGNLKEFITDEILIYDKLFTQGHMTLMKNSPKINRLFMTPINGQEYYKTVLQSQDSYNFDEDFLDKININTICRQQGIEIWENAMIADIYTKSSDFRRITNEGIERKSKNYYVWNNGKLFRQIKVTNKWFAEEYMYIHLQKRNMKVNVSLDSLIFKIIPNEFALIEINKEDIGIKDDIVKVKNVNLHYFKIRFKNLKIKLKRRFM